MSETGELPIVRPFSGGTWCVNSCQQAEKRTGESTKKRPPATRCKKVKQCVSLFSLNAILCLGPWTSPGVFLGLVNYVRWDFPQFQSPQVPNSASFIFSRTIFRFPMFLVVVVSPKRWLWLFKNSRPFGETGLARQDQMDVASPYMPRRTAICWRASIQTMGKPW